MRRLRRPWPVVPSLPLTSCKLSMAGPKGKLLKLLESPNWFPTDSQLVPCRPCLPLRVPVGWRPFLPWIPWIPWIRGIGEMSKLPTATAKGSHDSVPGFPSQKVPAQKLHELPSCPEDFWCLHIAESPHLVLHCHTVFIKQEMRAFCIGNTV